MNHRLSIKLILILLLLYQGLIFSQQWIVYKNNNSGLPWNYVYKIAVDSNNIIWIATTKGLARYDRINWTVWDTNNSPLKCDARIFSVAVDRYNFKWISNWMTGTNSNGVFKFDGENWVHYTVNNSGLSYNLVSAFAFEQNDAVWLSTFHGLNRFYNNQWIYYDTSNSNLHYDNIWTVTTDGHIKWLATYFQGISKFNDTTFIKYDMSNSGLSSNDIRDIFVDKHGNKWFATYQGGLVKFNSNINEWTVYNSGGIPSLFLNTVLVDKYERVWVGTANQNLGVLTDTGWVVFNNINSPIPGEEVRCLAFDRYGNLWIGTDDGLAVYNENGIIGINESNQYVSADFYLYQNYPNPFNSFTIIKYVINLKTYIRIEIFDIIGRKIKMLDEGKKDIGQYEIRLNANNLSSGIYFYKLTSEKSSEVRKLLIIK